jgi:hypothetical protein
MNLIKVRGDDLLAQLVIFRGHERHTQTSKQSDQGLDNAIGVRPGVGIGRLDLAERRCDHKQPVRIGTHATEPINKHRTIGGERVNQIAEVLRCSDGSPLVLLPRDCRRVFASEHLNNNTPVHVIQALLGHASPDTVMIYAKLYPGQLIEEYRKTVRSLYNAYYGEDDLKNPTVEEWGRLRVELQPARYGHAPMRLTHWSALSEGIDLPRLCACAAEEKCGADLSTHAGQPRAQPGGCAR